MANNGRVTASQVKTNFDTDLTDSEIDGWVDTATELVDDISKKDTSIDTTRLEQIELALTRAFASAQDPRITSASRETASVDYLRDENPYLMQAKALDPTNTLQSMSKPDAKLYSTDTKSLDD